MVFGFFKQMSENESWQKFWSKPVVAFCTGWGYVCILMEKIVLPVKYNLTYKGEPLSQDQSYLILSNHQSMTDIPVLVRAVLGKVPFMRFFAKASLKKVPVFGTAWTAIDCPFMKRYSKEFLAQNPHLKGKDLEETIASCRKLRHSHVSITNYVEGTRFTLKKHEETQSPYKHLLAPRAGGVALAIAALEGKLQKIVDLTVYYHQKQNTLWDYLCGRLKEVTVHVEVREIPAHFYQGDYQNDPEFKAEFQAWLNVIWQDKDQLLDTIDKSVSLDISEKDIASSKTP